LRQVLGTHAELGQEQEFRTLFPDCEVGAEPPFGNLFHLDTLVATTLTTDEEIVFNAGSHWQTVRACATRISPASSSRASLPSPSIYRTPSGISLAKLSANRANASEESLGLLRGICH
jgi:hypothetical protein